MSKKASAKELNSLHALVAKSLAEGLENPEERLKYLSMAIKFLNDNKIQADIEFNENLTNLEQVVNNVIDISKLPFNTGS